MKNRYTSLILLIDVILSIFIGRTLLAHSYNAPRLFDLFSSLTTLGALLVLAQGYRRLRPFDWLLALGWGRWSARGCCSPHSFRPIRFSELWTTPTGRRSCAGCSRSWRRWALARRPMPACAKNTGLQSELEVCDDNR